METTNNITSSLLTIFQAAFVPNDTRKIYDWASDYVTLSNGYAITGKFSVDISPHFKKIFDAYQDPYVRELNILAPPRSGKTLIAELCLLHTLTNHSGDILWLQENDNKADIMSDLRMVPLLKSCKPVADLIPSDRFAITDNRYKFLHSTVHVTSPKPSTLNAVGYKFIYGDECWRYTGDSIINDIKRRADDYKGVSKCLFFSQGGLKDSAWYKQYHNGECYNYGWTCQKCLKLQDFVFQGQREDKTRYGIVWPNNNTTKDENNKWIIRECAKQAVLECYHCRYQVTDNPQNRKYLLDTGDYIRVNPNATDIDTSVKSFRFTNLCNVKLTFGELVTRFLQAMANKDFFGSTSDLESFVTKDMADFWDEYQKKTRINIRLTAYDTDKPFGEFEAHRFMTIDVQKAEFYYVVRSWTKNGESRLINYGVCKTWNEIDAIRERNKVDYRFVFVDVADGQRRESILSECVKRGRWGNLDGEDVWLCYNAVRGDKGKRWQHTDNKSYRYKEPTEFAVGSSGDEDNEGKSVNHISFSSFAMTQILETLRDGKGRKWEANDVSEEYTNHLNSFILQRKLKGNTAEWEYVDKPNVPNHWADCEKIQVLAADVWELLDACEVVSDESTDNPSE